MKLNSMPNFDKPRERLIKYGVENLSNADLISIIINSGTKNYNVKEVSNNLLSKVKKINELKDLTISEYTSIPGLGKVKALKLISAIELGKRVNNKEIDDKVSLNDSNLIFKYFSPIICDSNQEELLVILLDNMKRLVNYKVLYKGTSNKSVVSVKEIFNYVIKEKCDAFIIMHNHPSGYLKPSNADIDLTNKLIEISKLMGVPLLDHIITNGIKYYSFYKEGLKNEV